MDLEGKSELGGGKRGKGEASLPAGGTLRGDETGRRQTG